jgi:microcystin-dependent protein
MPYKDFQAAQVLPAQDVDAYLMNQSVIVFDSATQRNATLTTPIEGMVTYLKDSNSVWVYDGTQWQNLSTPTGTVQSFAGVSAPAGWILCAGQAISRTDFSQLFAVLGTTYGVGNGTTTFNVPDLRGRVPAGLDVDMSASGGTGITSRITNAVSGITGTTLGASGGNQAVPDHTHQHVSPVGLNSGAIRVWDAGDANLDAVGSYNLNQVVSGLQGSLTRFSDLIERWYVTSGVQSTKGTSQNVQPTIVMNYIIKI